MKKWKSEVAYSFLVISAVVCSYLQMRCYVECEDRRCEKTSNMYQGNSRSYPKEHWKFKVSESCVNCRHSSFVRKHWDEDGLFCENCKINHTGRIDTHFLYDAALMCMKCGHEENIPKGHEELDINCGKCKMGHSDHYDKKILKVERNKHDK